MAKNTEKTVHASLASNHQQRDFFNLVGSRARKSVGVCEGPQMSFFLRFYHRGGGEGFTNEMPGN